MTRLAPRVLHASAARATAAGSPEITVWSGAFRFAATTTSPPVDESRQAASTSADRKSTRLNSSHSQISYAVFCLKKKKKNRLRSLCVEAVLPTTAKPLIDTHY